jgi:hypothetical protein
MHLPKEILLFVWLLCVASGCSLRGQDLSKESFQGTIKYAVIRGDPGAAQDGTASTTQPVP